MGFINKKLNWRLVRLQIAAFSVTYKRCCDQKRFMCDGNVYRVVRKQIDMFTIRLFLLLSKE